MELWDVYDENRNLTGRTHERGAQMQTGDYHLVVHVWIQNNCGEYLISKRTPNKQFPNQWECSGGSALAGEDSLVAAIRETREEIGIILKLENGKLILSRKRDKSVNPHFTDVWLFTQDADISEVVLQEDETCAAKWATPDDIREMLKNGEFVPSFDYFELMFDKVK